ncbi:MAG: phosphate ABC transporter ATPase [Solibacillus sp.]
MLKGLQKISMILVAVVLMVTLVPLTQPVQAATSFTFVEFTYADTTQPDGTVKSVLSKVTLENESGRTAQYAIDANKIYLYVNNTVTTPQGFKKGMPVTFERNFNKVTELRGTSIDIEESAIVAESKHKAGVVTKIDPNGLFITVKLDASSIQPEAGKPLNANTTQTYYVNSNTTYFKDSQNVDLSTLYEGDRVKLHFSGMNSSAVASLEIIATGVLIENLYKAQLNTVNAMENTITVKNPHPFANWAFGQSTTNNQTVFSFTNATSIYAGNKEITKNQLKNYRNSDLYYVTVKQFSKEVVKKMVVLTQNERTFYQPLTGVNTTYNFFKLETAGQLYYHAGSILVRNGRLVDATSLAASGTMYVVTDGNTSSKYAHVANITNDSFTSPNLAKHNLYFGKITLADIDNYLVELDELRIFENNFWKQTTTPTVLAYSNSTRADELNGNTKVKIIPQDELFLYEDYYYGYFYEKDGHIQAMYLSDATKRAEITTTGRIDKVTRNTVSVKDVSQWTSSGNWSYFGENSYDLAKAMIIKDGKVIQPADLKVHDRLVLLLDSQLRVQVVLVNE